MCSIAINFRFLFSFFLKYGQPAGPPGSKAWHLGAAPGWPGSCGRRCFGSFLSSPTAHARHLRALASSSRRSRGSPAELLFPGLNASLGISLCPLHKVRISAHLPSPSFTNFFSPAIYSFRVQVKEKLW